MTNAELYSICFFIAAFALCYTKRVLNDTKKAKEELKRLRDENKNI